MSDQTCSHTERLVTVCDRCLMATCWHGTFMCDDAKGAGTVEKTVGELQKLDREHPSYWFIDPATGQIDGEAYALYEESYRTDEKDVDGASYCSYGHPTKASCDCGPIAENE